jgi:hypothetical protein
MNNRFTFSSLVLAILLAIVPTRSSATINCPLTTAVLYCITLGGGFLVACEVIDDLINEPSRDEWKVIDANALCKKIEEAYKDKQLPEIILELQQNNPDNANAFKQPYHMVAHKLVSYHHKLHLQEQKLKSVPVKDFGCLHSQKETFAHITAALELTADTLSTVIQSPEYKTEKATA